jgi:hypothetical protein
LQIIVVELWVIEDQPLPWVLCTHFEHIKADTDGSETTKNDSSNHHDDTRLVHEVVGETHWSTILYVLFCDLIPYHFIFTLLGIFVLIVIGLNRYVLFAFLWQLV